jgi:hypothetical protein
MLKDPEIRAIAMPERGMKINAAVGDFKIKRTD